jgi:endonuclease/exonuclease/phosphatase family metal-dependent hydrolase
MLRLVVQALARCDLSTTLRHSSVMGRTRATMTSIRIATFNVLCAHLLTGPTWSERQTLMRRSIESARADVMGLQEVVASRLADVANMVAPLTLVPGPSTGPPRWFVSTASPERSHAGEHLPIAYRSDRFDLLDTGGFWVSATPEHPGSRLPLAPAPFLVHWARLAALDAPESLLVLNAHFGHAPWHHVPTARIVAAQLGELEATNVDRHDREPSTASVFLLGDFNAVPSSRLLRSLTSPAGARFVDAARSAPARAGPPVTYHWGRGATRFGLTLDYVLARTSRIARRAEVIDVHEGRLYPSDHHLVVIEFSPPPPRSPDSAGCALQCAIPYERRADEESTQASGQRGF